MAENEKENEVDVNVEFDHLRDEVAGIIEKYSQAPYEDATISPQDILYLCFLFGDFHVYLTNPYLETTLPPVIIPAAYDEAKKRMEHVYSIFDFGDHLSASVGEDLAKGLRANGKLLNTVEKMINIALARAKEKTGGTPDFEIQLAFRGHEMAKRKGFEVCIESNENVTVSNFEPGEWGERKLKTMEILAQKGYLRKLR